MKISSYSLSLCIQDELNRLGIRNGLFNFNTEFSAYELSKIEVLNITGCSSLDGIENLKNLKVLRLIGANLDNFSYHQSINDITDFRKISELTSLVELVIWHDNNIKVLDLRNLEKLEKLNLSTNNNLTEIKGLDEITTLKSICITGSRITNIGSPIKYIESTKNASINVLDIKMYEPIFSKNEVFHKLRNSLVENESNIRFGERIYFHDQVYTLSLEQMRELNRLSKKIINSLKIEDKTDEVKSFEIYKYVINHVSYDFEGILYRNKNYEKYLSAPKEEKEYFLRKMAFINSSLSALKKKKTVCDGYVNTLIYLLSLVNIKALPVICENKGTLHTAIKILIDGEFIYADPEKDSGEKSIRFYNLTRDELAKMYDLALQEYMDHLDGGAYVKRFE